MSARAPVIIDTFAEAFDMHFARLVVSAFDDHWLNAALSEFCGYGSSVIACDAEVGVEKRLTTEESPDGRVAAQVLLFGFSREGIGKSLVKRVGQCLMTCPTTSVFDGLPESDKRVPLGKSLRFFGDGFQKSKQIEEERFWRVPVMDGEFFVVETIGTGKGVGGGNLILQASTLPLALFAARKAVDRISQLAGVITPFPGGVARSGSKVGSKYKGLVASTSDAYCPTLRGRVESQLLPDANAALEIVIDGISFEAIQAAMREAISVLQDCDLVAVGAGNYGGKLGAHHFHLTALSDANGTRIEP